MKGSGDTWRVIDAGFAVKSILLNTKTDERWPLPGKVRR